MNDYPESKERFHRPQIGENDLVIRFCVNPKCPSQRPDGTGRRIGASKKGEPYVSQCKECGKWSVYNPPMFREEYAVALDKPPDFW